jgi:hypothetical protein
MEEGERRAESEDTTSGATFLTSDLECVRRELRLVVADASPGRPVGCAGAHRRGRSKRKRCGTACGSRMQKALEKSPAAPRPAADGARKRRVNRKTASAARVCVQPRVPFCERSGGENDMLEQLGRACNPECLSAGACPWRLLPALVKIKRERPRGQEWRRGKGGPRARKPH